MKRFNDIIFSKTSIPKGVQAMLIFPDGHELSVVQNEMSYGGTRGLYEIAVLKDREQVEMPGITEHGSTTAGYLSKDSVVAKVKQMVLVTGGDPIQFSHGP